MSKSLLKRSLEIVEASSSSSNRTSGKCDENVTIPQQTLHTQFFAPAASKQARNPFAPPSSTEQLAIYRGSVGKPSAAKAKGTRSAAATVPAKSAKSVKSAIQVAHEHIRNGQNRVDENLTKLLMFSAVKLDEATTTKVWTQERQRTADSS